MKTTALAIFFSLLAGLLFAAEEAPVQAFRVTGLFDAEREAELRVTLEKLPGVELVRVDFDHAEATFRYDPAIFPRTKPADLPKRFNGLLGSASNGTFGVKPRTATPREKLTRLEIPIAGLDCRACCFAAYEAVAKLDGVEQATASFRDGRLSALIDPVKTNRAALEAALRKKRVEVSP